MTCAWMCSFMLLILSLRFSTRPRLLLRKPLADCMVIFQWGFSSQLSICQTTLEMETICNLLLRMHSTLWSPSIFGIMVCSKCNSLATRRLRWTLWQQSCTWFADCVFGSTYTFAGFADVEVFTLPHLIHADSVQSMDCAWTALGLRFGGCSA
jgi:hypothetical protein